MTVHFYPRSAIGLAPPNIAHLSHRSAVDAGRDHQGLTWHWTGEGGRLFHPNPFTRLHGIQAYHMQTLGYGDIAYHGAFDADGNTFGLRDSLLVGAHALSNNNEANRQTDGIVFLEDRRGWTQDALHAFAWWCDLYRFAHGRSPKLFAHEWWAHSHGGTTTQCPGSALENVVRYLGGNT